MEAVGIFLAIALLVAYAPTLIDFLICYSLERKYKKLCEKKKKDIKNK